VVRVDLADRVTIFGEVEFDGSRGVLGFESADLGLADAAEFLERQSAAEHPGKSVLVLCGHTHSPGIYRDGNILVLTAGARYGFPDITKRIHLNRLGSIFE
jgi:hypothetical protein